MPASRRGVHGETDTADVRGAGNIADPACDCAWKQTSPQVGVARSEGPLDFDFREQQVCAVPFLQQAIFGSCPEEIAIAASGSTEAGSIDAISARLVTQRDSRSRMERDRRTEGRVPYPSQTMTRPPELASEKTLKWATGRGVDVWDLFIAAIAGDLAAIRRLLDSDPSLVRTHYRYRTPIYFAVRENQVGAARLLLERGADPLSLAVDDTMIEIARDRGYAEMEQLLVAHNARAHGARAEGNPVCKAIRERDGEKARALLDASPGLLHRGDESSNQPIHWAVMSRQIDLIDDALARGADINARRFDGARPLQLVNGDYAYRGWRDVPEDCPHSAADVLKHLIARGAEVDINTASYMGDLDRVRALLEHDATLANRVSDYVTYYLGSGAPLKNAAARGHIEVVKLLLDRGADPNLPEEGIAPHGHALYSAVYNKHYEVAKLLLERGAYPSPEVESSADALSIALSHSDQKMVDLLVSYGSRQNVDLLVHYGDVRTAAAVFDANPELANNEDAFHGAAASANEGMVRLMLRHRPDLIHRVSTASKTAEFTEHLFALGMDPNGRDWMGFTPMHEIARKGQLERAAQFLDHGADLALRDDHIRSTPLAWAAKFGQKAMVEFLLSRGAKPSLPDDPPWATPLAWATRRGHAEVAALLA